MHTENVECMSRCDVHDYYDVNFIAAMKPHMTCKTHAELRAEGCPCGCIPTVGGCPSCNEQCVTRTAAGNHTEGSNCDETCSSSQVMMFVGKYGKKKCVHRKSM